MRPLPGWAPVSSNAMWPSPRISNWSAVMRRTDLHTTTNILVTPLAEEVHQAIHAGCAGHQRRDRHAGQRRVPHERHHAGGVQDAARQDGCLNPRAKTPEEYRRTARRTSAPICMRARAAAI